MVKSASTKLIREITGGESYEYYPLGRYIVAALGVCGGRPTFKYTRIDVHHAFGIPTLNHDLRREPDYFDAY